MSLFPRIRSGTPRIQQANISFLKLINLCQDITALMQRIRQLQRAPEAGVANYILIEDPLITDDSATSERV